jgi:hypothetical protein
MEDSDERIRIVGEDPFDPIFGWVWFRELELRQAGVRP